MSSNQSLSNHTTAIINKEDCEKLNQSKVTRKNKTFYTHPLTQREINDSKFQKINKHCISLNDEAYIEKLINKWIQYPNRDPLNHIKIPISIHLSSNYAKLYYMAFDFFVQKNIDLETIKNKLPDKHLLFNKKIDVLFYQKTRDDNKLNDNYKMHSSIYEYIIKSVTVHLDYTTYENHIIKELVVSFLYCLQEYIRYTIYIMHTEFNELSDYVQDIKDMMNSLDFVKNIIVYFNIYSKFYKALKTEKDINDNIYNSLLVDFNENELIGIDLTIYTVISSEDVCENLFNYIYETYKIYNYAQDPLSSPFENINNKKIELIEDPLVELLDNIGIKNIDLETLEIPKRVFSNDIEYDKYLQRYSQIKTRYRQKIESWKEVYTKYEESKQKGESLAKSPSPPKQPSIQLPDGKLLNVATQLFPYYIKDIEYEKTLETYKQKETTIRMYKDLMKKGILNLVNKAKNTAVKSINLPLINKNIDFFKKNVLNGNTGYTCNTDIDIISQENFKDSNYPLAKLQLMFQLHTTNKNTKRIDCFYAPNFYNYVVKKINKNLPILNPVTNLVINFQEFEKAMDDLMQIMVILKPDIERPFFILPRYDNEYLINYKTIQQNGNSYYEVYTTRKFGNVTFNICNICIFPADIEIEDTGTTIHTSSVFLNNIIKLFDDFILMNTYVPPYYVEYEDGYREYVKLEVHFNNYSYIEQWENLSKDEIIAKFIHYSEEINNYVS
jgi:hypothetical protein